MNRSRANFCFKSEKTRSLHECKKRKTRHRLVNDLIYHKRILVEQLNICILSSELCRDRVLQWPVIYMYCDILPNVFGVVFPPISSFLVLPLLFLYALHVNIHTSVICRVGFPSNCIFIYTVMWFLLFFLIICLFADSVLDEGTPFVLTPCTKVYSSTPSSSSSFSFHYRANVRLSML